MKNAPEAQHMDRKNANIQQVLAQSVLKYMFKQKFFNTFKNKLLNLSATK